MAGVAAAAITMVCALPSGAVAAGDPAKQIEALQKIKRSLSPGERKLDGRLAVELRQGKAGTTEVDITVSKPDEALVARLQQAGATVRHVASTGEIRAAVPASALRTVATWGAVERIEPAAQAMTARIGGRTLSKEERAEITAAARAAVVTSEGVRAHAADTARETTKVTGIGTKLCALSDGVDSLAASQAAGELPAVDVLPDQAGSGDEGTAMLEILHDMAPGAELGFASAFISDASFADNIRALRSEAGCDVIVDDVLYFNESPFEDGPIAQAVNDVTADGALYFSSAGNEGNVLDGTSGNYEGDFRGSGQTVGKFAGEAHDFDPGEPVQVFEPISPDSDDGVPVTLWWANQLGAAADDYDLYLFDGTGTVVNFAQDVQDGDDDPYELLFTPDFGGSGLRLAVVRFAGAPKYLQLSALRGRFEAAGALPAWVSPGVTRGHSAAADAFSIAAAPAATALPYALEPGDPPNPTGPFPGSFTSAQLPERFTSDGPRRVFFPTEQVRAKPDFTAADGVSTSVEGFQPFFGTSAAAPSAAGIAALVLSGNPSASIADVREAFGATALDLAPAGVDGRTGAGVLRADSVLSYTGATPQPLVRASAPDVTVTTGDGDAFLEPGETARLRLPVTNVGDGTATGVSVTVSTGDAKAVVTPRSQSYGEIAPGITRSQDYTLRLAADYPLGKRVPLNVRVTFAGVLSPTSDAFSLPTGQPGTAATKFSYTGPVVPIPDVSTLGVTVTIPVAGFGYASKLRFSIDGATCNTTVGSTTVGIDHSFTGDLTGTLIAPSGAEARLFQRVGGTGNNLCQVVFDDTSTRPFQSVTASLAPFTGTWKPFEPLGGLLDAAADGDWKFKVTDGARLDTGSVRAVSLELTGFVR
ncbi:S8 family serine peptidase [Solirubrobacter phytolaccae]